MSIVLKQTGIYRDGGSKSYKGDDGKDYWQSFQLGDKYKDNRGKIFEGNINDKDHILAKGTFTLVSQFSNMKVTFTQ